MLQITLYDSASFFLYIPATNVITYNLSLVWQTSAVDVHCHFSHQRMHTSSVWCWRRQLHVRCSGALDSTLPTLTDDNNARKPPQPKL